MTVPRVFDRSLLRTRRHRAADGFSAHSALFDEIAEQIVERLGDIKQTFHTALDLGAHRGALAAKLSERGIPFVVAADISEKMLRRKPAVAADEEILPFAPASFDLVVSNLSLHWTNDLPGALLQIRNVLRPGGLFLAALIGGNSLYELRTSLMEAELSITGGVSPRLSPTIDLPAGSALLQRAGFAMPVTDEEAVTLTYPDIFALMRDLRGMGETNTHAQRLRRPPPRRLFAEAGRLYRARFAGSDGRIPATFEIVFLHGTQIDP
ncbi:MAG: methyltransferase domain-containing protein [Bdellovibrionales bacterium]